MSSVQVSDSIPRPNHSVIKKIKAFLEEAPPAECANDSTPLLLFDEKSKAYYLNCHLTADVLVALSDTDAVLDPLSSEEYKLNRNIYTDTYAYQIMEEDALKGRSFEDIVAEYDQSYRPDHPLKIYGGQHRIEAIKKAVKNKGEIFHGLRLYFDLTTDQRLEIATVSNTSIAVSTDLLDRMQEEWLGTELRDWSQSVGLLSKGQNFADKRSSEGIPTVRVVRTLLLNFHRARSARLSDLHAPRVCKPGPGIDTDYRNLRAQINWADPILREMGRQFARLHTLQRERVTKRTADSYQEFANKAIHPCVAAAWAYIAGLLSATPTSLAAHYALTDAVANQPLLDPLNAKALSNARLKGIDPDTYRGLGARINPTELGRMAELFLLQATKASKRGIAKKLADAAIQSYEAKKSQAQADKAIKGI